MSNQSSDIQRFLIELINSSKPKVSPNRAIRFPVEPMTDEDLEFFKLANEVVKKHQYRIDPTIRDILNRLQYAHSPHGGLPMAREYLGVQADGLIGQREFPSAAEMEPRGSRSSDMFPHLDQDVFKRQQQYPNGHVGSSLYAQHAELQNTELISQLAASIKSMDPVAQRELLQKLSGAISTNGSSQSPTSSSTHSQQLPLLQELGFQRIAQNTREKEQVTNSNHLTATSPEPQPKSHVCGTCSMTFKRSSDLKRHEKIHLEVPPNICPQCRKGFARKDALKRHIDTLTCKRNRERLLSKLNEENLSDSE
ncbi:hypothetical protein KL935_000765 [Ogataea polymorpha]|uniref:uncharacterized protein n=1 Tax=Ogataea polymorpha TaxID=460523 RepID=UPI0007F4B4D5|nr:uncharacterized protein OGAPODRAFT_75324 [Ogataea polymorpha]KAG7903233.1 hypothetical protein KL935_000765 [Ogataea polymorpha]KAG7938182.1 hypothetical protein KL934_000756 [Ogataea polymorpha]OBA17381.1 hypothetical protein OGAPODRAFT_75324 [Ogataea polymorpha]